MQKQKGQRLSISSAKQESYTSQFPGPWPVLPWAKCAHFRVTPCLSGFSLKFFFFHPPASGSEKPPRLKSVFGLWLFPPCLLLVSTVCFFSPLCSLLLSTVCFFSPLCVSFLLCVFYFLHCAFTFLHCVFLFSTVSLLFSTVCFFSPLCLLIFSNVCFFLHWVS